MRAITTNHATKRYPLWSIAGALTLLSLGCNALSLEQSDNSDSIVTTTDEISNSSAAKLSADAQLRFVAKRGLAGADAKYHVQGAQTHSPFLCGQSIRRRL